MITENLSTLKIHKLTQEQYNRELATGNIDETALYLTPDDEECLTEEQVISMINLNKPVNYVVEEGSSGIWTYRKWKNGVAECWCRYVGTVDITWNGFGVYYCSVRVDYPFAFDGYPVVQINGGSLTHANWAREFGSDASSAAFMVCANESQSDISVIAHIYAKGVLGTSSEPTIPTTESLSLSYTTGNDVSDANNNPHTGYVAVGHSSSQIKNDAVWSFTPTINVSFATFTFNWNNYTSSGSNTGWAGAMDYAFAITTDGSSGLQAANTSNKNVVSIGGSGTSGTATVNFTGLNLVAGTTYYIRANYNGTTNSTLKAFAKTDNTVQLAT